MTDSPIGKDSTLPPTPQLSPEQFEDFTERLLSAHRSCPEPLRRVVRVERWGRRGDKQDGIDFEGTWSDGKTAAWQCKRYDRLTAAQVREIVAECTFEADEYYLTYSGEASSAARNEIRRHDKWQLLDQRGLGRMLDDLPLHKRRQVLDTTWGIPIRKQLLNMAAEDALLPVEDYAISRQDPNNLLNDQGPLVGRTEELEALGTSLDRAGDWPPIILVTGPGGRGKTRLVTHALESYGRSNPTVQVLCLSPGRLWDSDVLHELPHTPSVIWVDDAHRDPSSLAPLLQYARRTAGTQLILSARQSGRDQVRAELVASGIRTQQIQEVSIGELSRGQARELVRSLADGLELSIAFIEHLVEQAQDSPFVAVLALNLVRCGELNGHLALDQGFREQILLRYQMILTENLNDFSGHKVRQTLAVFAALGPVDDEDDVLRSKMASFSELDVGSFLRLIALLKDRGVLVARSGFTRVAPDVLADQVLEGESAISGHDTGFASRLWNTFGGLCRTRLVVALSELDWRLQRQGGPSIIGSVETALHEEIANANLAGLVNALTTLEPLGYTQPHLLIKLLEVVRQRLAAPELAAQAKPLASGDLYEFVRQGAGLPPLTVSDVEHRMSKLYGQCASNAPDVLEQALDALWDFRRRDTRATNPHSDHPARVITDNLGNLGELPDPSFPIRISERVSVWLAEPGRPDDVDTPMFALEPLLAKQGSRYVATSRRQISITPFLVAPKAVRSLRDAVRQTLLVQASGPDIWRAGAAIRLLGDALREPRGMFGHEIRDDQVKAWEEDDLETLEILTASANNTGSAVVRRLIRRQVEWSAEYSRSAKVRFSALTLLINLDERGDDLAEALLGGFIGLSTDRKGDNVPPLADIEASIASQAQRRAGLSEEEYQAEHSASISALISRRDKERAERIARVVQSLADLGDVDRALDAIEQSCRDIQRAAANQTSVPGLDALLGSLAAAESNRVSALVRAVAARPQGPLDEGLSLLLGVWGDQDAESLLHWLGEFSLQRAGVRHSIAVAFDRYGWTRRGDRFLEVFNIGIGDSDDKTRNRFLQGSHELLAAQPTNVVELLLGADISSFSATRLIQAAARYDGLSWGQSLDEQGALAILRLLGRADWNDDTVQLTCAGIAHNFPSAVLEHFMYQDRSDPLPFEVESLADAFDQNHAQLVAWLVGRARETYDDRARVIVGLVMGSGMTSLQAAAVARAIETLDSQSLINLVDLLYDVPIWPLQHPLVARQLLSRALSTGIGVADLMRKLADAMHVRVAGFENGISEDLNHALTLASRAAAAEDLDALRTMYESAANYIAEQIAQIEDRFNEEFG
ncbi:restriction endonuclease [Arthrobacter sp. MPF02]|uniref:restriction endonuclease n=1 Tax=Arthrobacter sp. MPF02 TaxID=3388492 RepID=UPI003984F270